MRNSAARQGGTRTTISIDGATLDTVREAANVEGRSTSQMTRRLIGEALAERARQATRRSGRVRR